jgi:hypothetical protein
MGCAESLPAEISQREDLREDPTFRADRYNPDYLCKALKQNPTLR